MGWGRALSLTLLAAVACGRTFAAAAADADAGTGASTTDAPVTEDESGGEAVEPCANAFALLQPGPARSLSGFELCADGFIHRAQALSCDPGGFGEGDCNPWPGSAGECEADGECVADDGARGVCLDGDEPWAGCRCSFGCRSDADCGEAEVCYCNGSRSQCIEATCRSSADCSGEALCGLVERIGACGNVSRSLACTTAADQCRIDDHCEPCLQCLPMGDAPARACSGSTGVCSPCG